MSPTPYRPSLLAELAADRPPGEVLVRVSVVTIVPRAPGASPRRCPTRSAGLRLQPTSSELRTRAHSVPGGYTVRQLQQLELRVDLDHDSTVRAINWSLPDGTGATLEFVELEVVAPPIEPPPEDQRMRVWELLDDEEE